MNSQNSIYKPVNIITINEMNNNTYIYSSVNSIEVYCSNQTIFCNYTNNRVNSINLNGMNNIVYINHNSNNCIQNLYVLTIVLFSQIFKMIILWEKINLLFLIA